MALGNRFQTQQEAIASFNYSDIQAGVGTNIYYLASNGTTAGTTYTLLKQVQYSQDVELVQVGAGTTEVDFDLIPFKVPQDLKGTAYLSAGLRASGGTGYLTIQIRKVSGGVETDISAEVQSKGFGTAHGMILTPVALTGTPHFKIDDFLRVTIKLTQSAGAATFMGIDPIGRWGVGITAALTAPSMSTISAVHIPFRLPNL